MKPLSIFTFCILMALSGFSQEKKETHEMWDKTFTKAEVMPQFPGGDSAWAKFIVDSLRYPKTAMDKKIEGIVWVQFIVDPEGNLADIESFSGPRELREEAERILKISPKWLPAKQNGYVVKCYQKQAVTFKLK